MLKYGILEKSEENKKTSSGIEVSCLSMKYYRPNGSDGLHTSVRRRVAILSDRINHPVIVKYLLQTAVATPTSRPFPVK